MYAHSGSPKQMECCEVAPETILKCKRSTLIKFGEEEEGLVPYSGKFSRGPNFRDFHDPRPKRENKNRKIRNRENLNM